MTRQLIDLSVPTEPSPSEATPVGISTLDHRDAPVVLGLTVEDFPDGMGISNETVTLTSHTGTHLDAPLHYGPLSAGCPARSVSDVPLEWCYGDGVRLDVRHRGDGEAITTGDVEEAFERLGHRLRPGEIVLLWTGRDQLWGSAAYLTDYPGLSRDATAYLVERGARVIGTDAWGIDRPMATMISEYKRTGDRSVLWPAHLYGREREYCQLEKLANLDRLPRGTGFIVACFPAHLSGSGAAWTRVVAILEDR